MEAPGEPILPVITRATKIYRLGVERVLVVQPAEVMTKAPPHCQVRAWEPPIEARQKDVGTACGCRWKRSLLFEGEKVTKAGHMWSQLPVEEEGRREGLFLLFPFLCPFLFLFLCQAFLGDGEGSRRNGAPVRHVSASIPGVGRGPVMLSGPPSPEPPVPLSHPNQAFRHGRERTHTVLSRPSPAWLC